MDTNKKIIVVIVGFLMVGALVFILGGSAFSSSSNFNSGEIAQGLDFDSPELDEEEFDSSTKKEMYDENPEDYDANRYDSLANNLSFLQKMKKKIIPKKEKPKKVNKESKEVDKQLEMIMALQSNLKEQEKLQQLQGAQQGQQGLQGKGTQANGRAAVEPEIRVIPQEGSFFFGANSQTKTNGENLIPAETIDQGILKEGSTIAIRTKEPIVIEEQNITIPKGAVVYGFVQFEATRLIVNINKYRRDNTLYSINLNTHDFDGREGIHLKSRSVFSIPSNVTNDVYDTAVKSYEQQSSAAGTSDPVPIDQIAILSTAKEVAGEIFDTRRVFVPRKYHLWLTISKENNER